MVQFWVGMRRLTAHWKPLILFEILWKLVTLLVIAPACAGLIQLAIHLAKLKYLETLRTDGICASGCNTSVRINCST